MSKAQSVFCRSAPWRWAARSVVLPWGLRGFEPTGDVLEVGAGSGAMAVELLEAHPGASLTVTDIDPEMLDVARGRLAGFGDRATAREADATALPFDDGSFDAVLSWTMLHHTIEWERALAELVRVVRPGGHVVGFDLLTTKPMRLLHRHDGDQVRLMGLAELRAALGELPIEPPDVVPGLARSVVRFTLRRSTST